MLHEGFVQSFNVRTVSILSRNCGSEPKFQCHFLSPNETWTSRSRQETAKRKKLPVSADIRSIEGETKVFSDNLLAPRGILAATRPTRSSVFQSFSAKLNHSIQFPSLIKIQTASHPVRRTQLQHLEKGIILSPC